MRIALILVICALCIGSSYGVCWTAGPYHIAASALALGIGNVSSSSVCVYGANENLNPTCPLPCQTLLRATWGDCYCRDPTYKPDVGDSVVRPMNVRQIFELLATSAKQKGATCRDWLQENPDWKCAK